MFFFQAESATRTQAKSIVSPERGRPVIPNKGPKPLIIDPENPFYDRSLRTVVWTVVFTQVAFDSARQSINRGVQTGPKLFGIGQRLGEKVGNIAIEISKDPVVREGVKTFVEDALHAATPRLPEHLRPLAEHIPRYLNALTRAREIIGGNHIDQVDKSVNFWNQIQQELNDTRNGRA